MPLATKKTDVKSSNSYIQKKRKTKINVLLNRDFFKNKNSNRCFGHGNSKIEVIKLFGQMLAVLKSNENSPCHFTFILKIDSIVPSVARHRYCPFSFSPHNLGMKRDTTKEHEMNLIDICSIDLLNDFLSLFVFK